MNVVKALKWWRLLDRPGEYPKGYPLEHIIGACCPDGIASVAEGVARAFDPSTAVTYPTTQLTGWHIPVAVRVRERR